jgi:FAD/FMN-containing dehydrogenase
MKRRTFFQSSLAAVAAASIPHRRQLRALTTGVFQVPPDLDAVTGAGAGVTLRGRDVAELAASLRGRLLIAGDDGYDAARRILNPSFDKHPALVVQPTGSADVTSAVDFARAHDLLVAVKCGGHSFGGASTCDKGMQIDLSLFRGVRVDPAARRARVAGGTLLGDLDHEAMAHGLVTPMGTVSHTGVGGLTTGGGFGRVARRFGLALDNLTSIDVVAADGKLYRASAEENQDLFWGVRGGGGNFGVVTSFEFQLHPMERQIVGGVLLYPIAQMRDVLEVYAEYSPVAPDELYMDLLIIQEPGGAPGVAGFSVCYSGLERDAERALAPLRKLGTPMVDGVAAMDYLDLQRSGDTDDPRALGTYLTGGFFSEISQGLIDALVQGFQGDPRRATVVFFQQSGGAINRVPTTDTAFAHRYAAANLGVNTGWAFGDDPAEHMAYARGYWQQLKPHTEGFYTVDVPEGTTAQGVNENYRENFERLVSLKNRFDPSNLFRLNANVHPTA